MPKKAASKTQKPSVSNVSRTILVGTPGNEKVVDEQVSEDLVSAHLFQTNPAEVEMGIALTMNLGNYESAKIVVHLRVPCYKEEIDNAYIFAQKWVEDRVNKEKMLVDDWRGKSAKAEK